MVRKSAFVAFVGKDDAGSMRKQIHDAGLWVFRELPKTSEAEPLWREHIAPKLRLRLPSCFVVGDPVRRAQVKPWGDKYGIVPLEDGHAFVMNTVELVEVFGMDAHPDMYPDPELTALGGCQVKPILNIDGRRMDTPSLYVLRARFETYRHTTYYVGPAFDPDCPSAFFLRISHPVKPIKRKSSLQSVSSSDRGEKRSREESCDGDERQKRSFGGGSASSQPSLSEISSGGQEALFSEPDDADYLSLCDPAILQVLLFSD